ncbi:MAG: FecR domain-containing protein [Acidobacteriota bacterium]|jgi:ferric-dicitrate binding protein FerR (iron transport regulator)
MNDERFDEVLQDMRDEGVSRKQFEAARERVWRRLHEEHSLACDELRPMLGDYVAGRLNADRRLLVQDHLSRCVECRHALNRAKGKGKVVPMPVRSVRRAHWSRWAAAAAIVVVALWAGRGALDSALAPSGPNARVVKVSGTLYQPSGARIGTGSGINEGQVVRTAAGSHAVLELRDGSQVEMNQRTELTVQSARSGDTIRLSWGDVIVQAADQGNRDLRVVTRDSIASVKGTVFAVSSGTAGSLVSVVEGEVQVAQAGYANMLRAGQQAATNPALGEVSVVAAVSWSEEAPEYYALLSELSQLEQQLAESGPAMRYEAALVPYLPASASVYFAAPNLDGTIDQAISLLDQRSLSTSELGEWWLSESGREMRRTLEQLQSISALLGDEIVLVLSGSDEPVPLFLAEVRSGSSEELLRLLSEMVVDDEMPPVEVRDGLLVGSDSHANLALMSVQLGTGADSQFAAEITDHYRRGVGWLAAVDVSKYNAAVSDTEVSRLLGLSTMSYLFVEQRSGNSGDASEATLSFLGEREGIASWIAGPGAIGAAEYISPQAISASAGSTRDPQEAFDQLISLLGGDSEFMDGIRQMEEETGISVRNDIATSLGTDFVVSLEGMSLAEPMWMAAIEVMNPGALDEAVRRMVQTINSHESETGEQLALSEETVNGRTWKTISVVDSPARSVTWTYDRGYAVVSTSRDTAVRAIAVRDSASSLVRTSRFQQLIPAGTGLHSSGFYWLDLGRIVEVMEALGQPVTAIGDGEPMLVVITAEDDNIRWASNTRLTSLLFNFMFM